MAGSTYSTNLKIELMTTGENSGTWGDITNTNLGTAFEQAVIGLGNPDYTSDANLTITITNSNASQAARCLVLNVTSAFGSLTQTRELIVPTIQKQYIVQNNTTGGQSITVKTSAGTGITVPNGRKAHLYVNGTNVIQMFDFVNILGGTIDNATLGATTASSARVTTLNASGATTLDGTVALGNAAGDAITVPGTIGSNLIFTDNTYDIGASGATRPRNLFLAGAATVGGNLSVGGTLTLTGGVNLNGNVTVGDASTDTLTINSTITSNLIFTDNTYDIGASGATRPRNLFLAGNATIGGAQTLTGALTVDSTTDTSSATTGSIQTDGGVGIAKGLYVGGNTTLGDAGTDTVQINGYMGVGGSPVQQYGITIGTTNVITGSTTAASIRAVGTLGSSVTVNGSAINANVRTDAAAFTMALGATFYAQDATKGAGSTITNLHGLYISDQTQGTNNYGITSLVSSGTNKFNIYASGTAANYFAGNTGLGVVPNANWTDFTVFQNQQAAILGYDGQTHYTQNAYYQSGTWKYISASTFPATRYTHSSGIHYWFTATAGAANSTIAWTQGMTLTGASNLLVGTTNNHYSASIITGDPITTTWSGTIALRYNVSGQTNAYYKGMAGVSLIDGQARGLHIFNYDQDSNVGINFYPNNYAGQTATAAVTIASTGVLYSNYGQIVVAGTGSRGVRLSGLGAGEVAVAGDGATYAISHSFYNTTSYATTLGGMFAYTAGGAFQYLAIGPSYNSSSSLYIMANGNVGVGFGAPATKLDVNGTIRLTPNSADTNYTASIYGSYNSSHPFQIDVKNNGSTFEMWGVYADGGGSNNRVCSPSFPLVVGATGNVYNARVTVACASGTESIAFAVGSGVTRASGTQYGYSLYRDNTTETNAVTFVENGGSGNNAASYVVRTNAATGGTTVTSVSGGVALVNGATSWSSYSDLRLKHEVVPITNAIESILKIDPIFFKWNDRPEDQQRSIGVSAQSVEKVFPELIDRSGIYDVEGGAMQVRYTELIPVLLASIQEQQAIIESLKARLDAANL
jgi:hypothetical protein